MLLMRRLPVSVLLGTSLLLGMTACTQKGGGLMPSAAGTASPMTWESTAGMAKTVAIVDTRIGETVWEMHIPPGKQLSVQFIAPRDNALQGTSGPQMVWGLHEIGKWVGTMDRYVDVPHSWNRRVDVFIGKPKRYTPADIDRPVTPLNVPMPGAAKPAQPKGPTSTMTFMDTGSPNRISVIDTRTDKVFLAVDVPAKHDLVIYFHPLSTLRARSGEMEQARWQIVPAGTTVTKPKNRTMVPGPSHRDFTLEPLPEPPPLDVPEAPAPEAAAPTPPADEAAADASVPATPKPAVTAPPEPQASTESETTTDPAASAKLPPPPPPPAVRRTPRSTQTWTDTGSRRRVSVVDTRTGDAAFEVDIPKGHDLVLHFYDMWKPTDAGSDAEGMHWQIVPAGTGAPVPVHHANVPPAAHRQIREQSAEVATEPATPAPAPEPSTAPAEKPAESPPVDLIDGSSN